MNCLKALFSYCWSKPKPVNKPHYSSSTIPEKIKYKKQVIPDALRDSVWIKYHNINTEGICYCCGSKITKFKTEEKCTWQCSHVLAEARGGQLHIDNLRTCCKSCNCSMGDMNLYAYIYQQNKKGPGRKNMNNYFASHPDQKYSKRTNNFKKKINP
jgi:5-methylcytosine-specific restriction endonuclease McrA